MIEESMNNSSNIKIILFFQKMNSLFEFLSKLHLQDVEHFFILHDVTEFLHNNKLLASEELNILISGFDKVYFEVRYPHDQFNSICKIISEIFLYVTKLDGIGIIKAKDKIKGVKFDSSIDKIYEDAFSDCSSIIQILIPPTVNFIGSYAFINCTSLVQILIPPSVEVINAFAFKNSASLAQISIPPSVKRIVRFAFSNCKSLTQMTIPSYVTNIGEYTFNECSSIAQLSISSSITKIRSSTFFGCSSLTQIIIPSLVTNFGTLSFAKCSSVKEIIIPCS